MHFDPTHAIRIRAQNQIESLRLRAAAQQALYEAARSAFAAMPAEPPPNPMPDGAPSLSSLLHTRIARSHHDAMLKAHAHIRALNERIATYQQLIALLRTIEAQEQE